VTGWSYDEAGTLLEISSTQFLHPPGWCAFAQSLPDEAITVQVGPAMKGGPINRDCQPLLRKGTICHGQWGEYRF
jgi:hypothetical protein